MLETIAFVTNQFSGDRIISAAKQVADQTNTNLVVVGIMDNEYDLDPKAVDYLFSRSRDHGATMRLIFKEDSLETMMELTGQYTCQNIVTGMPSTNQSVIYQLWLTYPEKDFYTVDTNGILVEVDKKSIQNSQKKEGEHENCSWFRPCWYDVEKTLDSAFKG